MARNYSLALVAHLAVACPSTAIFDVDRDLGPDGKPRARQEALRPRQSEQITDVPDETRTPRRLIVLRPRSIEIQRRHELRVIGGTGKFLSTQESFGQYRKL